MSYQPHRTVSFKLVTRAHIYVMYVDYSCHTCAVHRIAKGVASLGQVFVFVFFFSTVDEEESSTKSQADSGKL